MDDAVPAVRTRAPAPHDASAAFEGSGGLHGTTDWPRVLQDHNPAAGTLVWVAECAGEVVGFAVGRLGADRLHIDLLSRNALSSAARGQKVGRKLIDAAVAVAWSMALPWVTLDSLDDPALVRFYEEAGFVKDGPPLFDAVWGTLHPMRRRP